MLNYIVYTLEEIEAERAKLNNFISEDSIPVDNEKVQLYTAINTLITESLKINDDVNVNDIHESFTFVFNHIKSPKKALLENVDVEIVNEDVIEIAVEKFNEKYTSLNENDKELLRTLIKSTTN